jgi:hypothetical protein
MEKRILPSKLPAKMTAGANSTQRRSEVILFMAGPKMIFGEKTQGGCVGGRDENRFFKAKEPREKCPMTIVHWAL